MICMLWWRATPVLLTIVAVAQVVHFAALGEDWLALERLFFAHVGAVLAGLIWFDAGRLRRAESDLRARRDAVLVDVSELTIEEYAGIGLPVSELRHGGIDNVCVKHHDDDEQYVFRCSKCRTWNCDCHGSADDGPALCDVCWCKENAEAIGR